MTRCRRRTRRRSSSSSSFVVWACIASHCLAFLRRPLHCFAMRAVALHCLAGWPCNREIQNPLSKPGICYRRRGGESGDSASADCETGRGRRMMTRGFSFDPFWVFGVSPRRHRRMRLRDLLRLDSPGVWGTISRGILAQGGEEGTGGGRGRASLTVIIFLAFLFVFGIRGRFLGAGGASWGTLGSSCAVLEPAASSEETGRNGRRARVTRYGSLEAVLGASYGSFGGLLRSFTRSLGRLLGSSSALPEPSWSWRRLGGKPVRNRRHARAACYGCLDVVLGAFYGPVFLGGFLRPSTMNVFSLLRRSWGPFGGFSTKTSTTTTTTITSTTTTTITTTTTTATIEQEGDEGELL